MDTYFETEPRSQSCEPNQCRRPRSQTPPRSIPQRPCVRRHTSSFKAIICKVCNQSYSTKATYDIHEKSHKHTINREYDVKIETDIKRRVIESKIEAYKIVMKTLQHEIDELTITLSSI